MAVAVVRPVRTPLTRGQIQFPSETVECYYKEMVLAPATDLPDRIRAKARFKNEGMLKMNRLHFLTGSAGIMMIPSLSFTAPVAGRQRVYFGTFTKGAGKGIFMSELDLKSGRLSDPVLAGEAVRAGFLSVHPAGTLLYAVGEEPGFSGKGADSVCAYAIDSVSGKLKYLNKQPGGGVEPCHLTIDPSGKYVLTAQYGGGSCSVFPIAEDGTLQPRSSFHQHEGFSGVNAKRQEAPHAHSIMLDPSGKLAVVADLGKDQLLVYRFDQASGTLDPVSAVDMPPGSGVRHSVFHPVKPFFYANMELSSSVSAFSYDAESGHFQCKETCSTLPAAWDGLKAVSEIRITPDGRFLYVANRGHDSIALFSIDQEDGTLTPVGHEPTRGKFPRNFNIDPSGRYLIAANQNSNSVVVFTIHPATGMLKYTGSEILIPKPVCVAFGQ